MRYVHFGAKKFPLTAHTEISDFLRLQNCAILSCTTHNKPSGVCIKFFNKKSALTALRLLGNGHRSSFHQEPSKNRYKLIISATNADIATSNKELPKWRQRQS